MGVALLAIVLASSCGSSKNALQTSALEGEWNIITVNGKEATADKDVFIGLNLKENRVYGCAGCNRIMGAIQVDKDKAGHLSFGQVASTRMLCSDMATERAVLEALENVTGYKGTEQELTLTDGNGNALFTLSKRPAATLASLNGKWDITKVYDEAVEDIENTEKTQKDIARQCRMQHRKWRHRTGRGKTRFTEVRQVAFHDDGRAGHDGRRQSAGSHEQSEKLYRQRRAYGCPVG